MYNLRYHIASLVAVFLALAVGLLLGGVVVERGTLDRQRDSIVKSLQEDFERLSTENHQLGETNARRRRFAEEALPGLLAGRLQGHAVAVVVDPSARDISGAVTSALSAAGAEVAVVRLQAEEFGLNDDSLASVLPTLPADDHQARVDALAATLAAEWSTSGPRPTSDRLRGAGVLGGDDLPARPITGIVAVAAWEGAEGSVAADEVLIALTESLERAGVRGVGVESTEAERGCVDAAAARGISSVDHVNEPEGAVSLVWLLAGRADGYFGIRQGADGEFPKLSAE